VCVCVCVCACVRACVRVCVCVCTEGMYAYSCMLTRVRSGVCVCVGGGAGMVGVAPCGPLWPPTYCAPLFGTPINCDVMPCCAVLCCHATLTLTLTLSLLLLLQVSGQASLPAPSQQPTAAL
jgi:hypothetical protein